MKAVGRHVWRLLFPQRIPSLRRRVIYITPYFPSAAQPTTKENRHAQPEQPAQKTSTSGSANR